MRTNLHRVSCIAKEVPFIWSQVTCNCTYKVEVSIPLVRYLTYFLLLGARFLYWSEKLGSEDIKSFTYFTVANVISAGSGALSSLVGWVIKIAVRNINLHHFNMLPSWSQIIKSQSEVGQLKSPTFTKSFLCRIVKGSVVSWLLLGGSANGYYS